MHSQVKVPPGFSVELDKLFLNVIWKYEGLRTAETAEEENSVRRHACPTPKPSSLSYTDQCKEAWRGGADTYTSG